MTGYQLAEDALRGSVETVPRSERPKPEASTSRADRASGAGARPVHHPDGVASSRRSDIPSRTRTCAAPSRGVEVSGVVVHTPIPTASDDAASTSSEPTAAAAPLDTING